MPSSHKLYNITGNHGEEVAFIVAPKSVGKLLKFLHENYDDDFRFEEFKSLEDFIRVSDFEDDEELENTVSLFDERAFEIRDASDIRIITTEDFN